MGMTIDDCIDELQKLKLPISKHDLSFHFVEHTRNKTVETAIETMRKYQKIQTIVKAWNDMNSFDSMVQISEVLEDGNDNN